MLPGEYADITAEDFDWSRYDNENLAAEPLVDHHKLQLAKFGLKIGKGGYSVLDLHKKKELCKVELQKMVYRGGVDAAVVPHSVAEESAGGMLRAAFEHNRPTAKDTSAANEVRSSQGLAG